MHQAPRGPCGQEPGVLIDWCPPRDQLHRRVERIVFDDRENSAGPQHSINVGYKQHPLLWSDVMEDANSRHPVDRLVIEREAERVHLVHRLELATLTYHPERYVATESPTEIRPRGTQQFSFAASHIKPYGLTNIESLAIRKFEHYVDFSGNEELRSRCKVLTHGIVKQFCVFGREVIEFLLHCLHYRPFLCRVTSGSGQYSLLQSSDAITMSG